MIIDHAIIQVRSGKGGDGCMSFRRLKYIPKGGPDGGSGGDGGSVILEARDDVDTLLDFAGRHHWRADAGKMGRGKDCDGKSADDLIVRLPAGTLVYDADTDELIVDMDRVGQTHVICKGGKGGRGNMYFATPTDQAPTHAEPGEPHEERNLRLELKLIAEVGLLGMPNAGKSTLLGAVSAARPRIADYPFTTLVPHPAIAELPGHRRIVIADIPGIIEDAADGAGLGIRFLRHIERTSLLLHLLEVDPTDGSDPATNYQVIRAELAKYSAELAAKPEVVVFSKADLMPDADDRAAAVELFKEQTGVTPMFISSATREGLDVLLETLWDRLGKVPQEEGNPWPNMRDAGG